MVVYSKYKGKRFLKDKVDEMRLVDEAFKIYLELEQVKKKYTNIKKQLIAICRKKTSKKKKGLIYLDSRDIRASVSFTKSTSYDSDVLEELISLLGQKQFDELFITKTSFKPNRSLEEFLKQAPNAKIEDAQKIIGKSQKVKSKAPTFKIYRLDKND